VSLDPRVEVTPAVLSEQLEASFAALRLVARVNQVQERMDDLLDQLQGLRSQLAREPAPKAMTSAANGGDGPDQGQESNPATAGSLTGDVDRAIATLKKIRDDQLVRPLPGLNYRQYPRLREDAQSLAGSMQRGFRPPNAGEKLRLQELSADLDVVAGKVNQVISTDLARINEALRARPRIAIDPVK
jgi:hypothetical protein